VSDDSGTGRPDEPGEDWLTSTQALVLTEGERRLLREGSEGEDGEPTQWFTFDEALDTGGMPALPRRRHHVTVVVVAHDGAVWLPAVVTGVANQSRPADVIVGVDTGSLDASAAIMRTAFGEDRVIEARRAGGFGDGIRAGLAFLERETAALPLGTQAAPRDAVPWVWLLHDDSAPTATCLEALLNTADDNPSATVLGPKILGWHDARLLLEAGVSITGSGRRFTGLDIGEHDQGQQDGVRDVMAVSSAGMLVRRDVWDALGGLDPKLPLFRDDLDFCWRAHRADQRVLIATDAVLHHREASAHGRRATGVKHPDRADREAAVHVLLAHASWWMAPFTAAKLLIGSILRSLAFLLGKDVRGARDEVAAVLAVALHPFNLRRSRKLIKRASTQPASVVRHLRPRRAWQFRQALEAFIGIATTSGATQGPTVSALESGPVDDDADFLEPTSSHVIKRLLLRPSVFMVTGLALLAFAATYSVWLGPGVLQGGALLPSPAGATDLWDRYAIAWHDVGPGSTTASAPYLMLVYPVAVLLFGKADVAVQAIVLLGIPIAAWAAYFTLRGAVASRVIRTWAAAAYALLPAVTGAVSSGRIGTMMAAILLPFAVRSFVRIARDQGTFRRAAGTALLLAALTAAVPALWCIALIAALVVVGDAWRTRGREAVAVTRRMALAIIAPMLLLMPWSLHLFAHPSLFLLEPGIASPSLNDPGITPLDILLQHPGGPGSTPIWLGAPLIVAGLFALVRRERLAPIVACWGLALAAFILGIVQVIVLVTPPGATTAIRSWPGPATLVLGAALIVAAALGADGLTARMSRSSFNVAQPLAGILAVGLILAPLGAVFFWFPDATAKLRKAPPSAVPAFVEADALGPPAPRTLIIREDSEGRVQYNLINGAGPMLGDADVSPGAEVWDRIDPLVSALASGRGGDEVTALAGYGVRYVLVSAGTSAELIPVLDGAPGLRRLATAGGETLWSIGGVTTRARVVAGEQEIPVDVAQRQLLDPNALLPIDPYVDSPTPEGSVPDGVLVVGATVDDGWRATATDASGQVQDLTLANGPGLLDWSGAFAIPESAQQVTVSFDQEPRGRWLWAQFVVLILLVVLALPSRQRHRDPDADADTSTMAAIR
jgi:GT2 family glycosyltransferase